jgi:hypothetical protein
MSENPYQPPAVSEVEAPSRLESHPRLIREKHLKCEASLKGMGTLFLIGGIFAIAVIVVMATAGFGAGTGTPRGPELLVMLLYLAFVPLQFLAWWGLRRLKPWSKVPAGILSAFGLAAIGLGTIISIYFLYLLFGKKGRMVLSPAYQTIIEQTPGMKYRTPVWNWIVLGAIVVLVVGGMAYWMMATPN